MVALLATGGSTNHLIHLPAIAASAGIVIDWEDFDRLSKVVPLLTRVYPNGSADVNAFQAAGGPPFVIRELLKAGLIHRDIRSEEHTSELQSLMRNYYAGLRLKKKHKHIMTK